MCASQNHSHATIKPNPSKTTMRDSSEKNMPRVATKQQATWAASKGKAAGIGGVKKNKRKKNNPAKMVAKAHHQKLQLAKN